MGFNPKISLIEAQYLFPNDRLGERKLDNNALYDLIGKIVDQVHPSREDKYEKRWEAFYLPLKKGSRLIAVPFSITEYEKEFYAFFSQLGALHIKKGHKKIEKVYRDLFEDALKFLSLIKKTDGQIIKWTVPYSFRTGRILGQYVLIKTLPVQEKERLMNAHERHLREQGKGQGCSLNDYLDTTALCYRAAFNKSAAGLRPLTMYKKWADTRNGGMLAIKNRTGKKEFYRWYKSKQWSGAHPFEIVFSLLDHGIHLYPPTAENSWKYSLAVTDRALVGVFIKMAETLIKSNIPFIAENFQEILDYLAGETYFDVNENGEDAMTYTHSPKEKSRYFRHIVWDPLKIPRFIC
ncbi:MAG: hypothetical protein HY401_00860 [Elusimicrobia bacterium]|nr:hypothetical protein [Elusimicrobiota bacterium]